MKIGLLITARLKSSRLPFKLIRDLNGFSIIEHVINRCKLIRGVSDIVLCTSTNGQDLPLVEISKSNDIYYFLGSEEDVLKRLSDCSDFFGFDYILSITGENPLLSIDHANLLVDRIKSKREDFIYIEGLPIGCAVYGINVKALKMICEIKKEIDTEIWGPLLNRPEIFKIGKIEVEEFYQKPSLRLTNDYFEDFQMMNKIFNSFPSKSIPSLFNVIQLLNECPEIEKLNANRTQLALNKETIDRINNFFEKNLDQIKVLKDKYYNNDF